MKKACRQCWHCGKCFQMRDGEGWRDWSKRKFCVQQHYWEWRKGNNHPNWKGGIRTRKDGYQRYSDDIYVHRKVMEEHLGRKLSWAEHVHHIDHDPTNNDISNLKIVLSSEHAKIHSERRKRDKLGRYL